MQKAETLILTSRYVQAFPKTTFAMVTGASISSLCHRAFLVHHKVELLPSEQATGQRTPTGGNDRY